MPVAAAKEEEKPTAKVTDELINTMMRGISGYVTSKADDGTNLATSLGCTMMGFTGCYNITSPEAAMAIRIAAKRKNQHAVFVILNLANVGDSYRYGSDDAEKLPHLFAAGWKVLAKMPGAHSTSNPTGTATSSKYESYLMGAFAAKGVDDLERMLLDELAQVDEAQFPPKKKPVKERAKKKVD